MPSKTTRRDTRLTAVPKIPVKGAKGMWDRHLIERVTPSVDGGRYPVKRVVGEPCVVEADVFRDGHEQVRAVIKWRRKRDRGFSEAPMWPLDNDRWRGEFPLAENSRYVFTIEAWTDTYASWLADFVKKATAGRDVASDLLEGTELLRKVANRTRGSDRDFLMETVKELSDIAPFEAARAVPTVSMEALTLITSRFGERSEASTYPGLFEVIADRMRARFGSWYEMFPRSQGTKPDQPSSLREAEARLSDIRDMGFDVVYLPPVHPIGITKRKGPNNSLQGGEAAPGSPWAIGNGAGGHTAVEPSLGTLEDFDHFVATARRLELEVALDFAIQCSPDHPWVQEHPEWFNHRPDGSIKYAENPPKEYQDIYPVNFNTSDKKHLIEELERALRFWIDHGVRIFRVDNPHTKPVEFWKWLIASIQERHSDVIFLSEAFTRPKLMKALAKVGFTQSYTYFTWRNNKAELIDYFSELTSEEAANYFRPNLFTNTPDILPEILQKGGRPAFKSRLALAATLSPSYGIYSGYELCEREAIPGTEEYLNSEKFEIKVRDWNQPGNIKQYIARVNEIRRKEPALHHLSNLVFLPADSDEILFYAKSTSDGRNTLLVAINLDPFRWHECTVTVPAAAIGVTPGSSYQVRDLLTGAVYSWSEYNYVRLDPEIEPAHILRVEKGV